MSEYIVLFIGILILSLFSILAFWKNNSVMFMLSAGTAVMVGFNCFDIDTQSWMLGISLMLWAYSITCLVFAMMCIFKREPADE